MTPNSSLRYRPTAVPAKVSPASSSAEPTPAADRASELALEGDIPAGYEVLLAGLAEARQAEAEELVARWQRAVEACAARWGVGRA